MKFPTRTLITAAACVPLLALTSITATLMNQFYCHWDAVRVVSPEKTFWNLESWKKDKGYWSFLASGCN